MKAALVLALLVAVQAKVIQVITAPKLLVPSLFTALSLVPQAATARPDFIEPQIVGGDEALPNEFPWQVGIFTHLRDGKAFCGGSLVDTRWVLTAAHCVAPGNEEVLKFEVVLGAHQINVPTEAGRVSFVVPAANGFPHADWKGVLSGNLSNDIALIKLPEDAPLSSTIQTIRLPSEKQRKNSFWRETVVISGWGIQHNSDTGVAPVLRKVTSTVVSNFYCKLRFFFMMASDTNICISGWGGKGACHGDSGGPMVLFEKDGPTLIGVTSFGFGPNCEWGWPSAYTRVTSYLDWVNSHVKA